MKKWLLVLVVLSTKLAFADRKFIIMDGSDGISAVSCWHGNLQTAINKAVAGGYQYCSSNLGGSPEENYEIMSSGCGQASTAVTICPHVCQARVKTYCQTN